MRRHLVIFARAPHLGTVKRRLARDIGAVAACRFYHATLHAVVRRLAHDRRWQSWLAVTGGAVRWPEGVRRLPQGKGSLGQRMQRVMRRMPPGPVVIVGTDIPDITRRHIDQAFRALGSHDAVFGPADDGGYWLVGLRRRPFIPGLDGPVRWSSRHALADTREILGLRVSIAYLETLIDVDTGEALRRWRAESARRKVYFS